MASGDDLNDDYVPDSDFPVDSEPEPESPELEDDQNYQESPPTVVNELDPATTKKRKRKDSVKEKKAKKRKLTAVQEIVEPPSIASQSPAEIQAYICSQQAKAFPNLSVLELEETRIPESWLIDTASYAGSRTLDHINDFLAEKLPSLLVRMGQKPRDNGAPTLIFVAGAALRVADVTRVLRKFRGQKGGEVAKLFARHFKLQEHITYLKRTKVGVAVGTPARLGQLLAKNALVLTALTHIIIDVTRRDAKQRSIMDIAETRDELFRGVLSNPNIQSAFHSGKLKLVLF